jgi:predicted Zn finger-like uncharacterized protein
MSLLCAYSWPYGDSEAEARTFFDALSNGHAAGKRLPFARHQVALVHSPHFDTWFVAVLVFTDSPGDDSVAITRANDSWFRECGAGGFQDSESVTIRGGTIRACFDHRYEVLATVGTIGDPVGPLPRPTPGALEKAIGEDDKAGKPPAAPSTRTVPAGKVAAGDAGGGGGKTANREFLRTTCPRCRKTLRVKTAAAGKKVRCPHCQHVFSVLHEDAASPDGAGLPAATPTPPNPGERARAIAMGRRVVLGGHGRPVEHLLISPDGKVLAATSGAWHLPRGEPLGILNERTNYEVSALAVSPDSRLLFAAGYDNGQPAMMRLWSLPEGRLLREWEGPHNYTQCAAFTPDGKVLATGTYPWSRADTHIYLWGMPEGAALQALKGHGARVCHVAVTPDGSTLVSADIEAVVRLWSLPKGKMLARCRTDLPGEPRSLTLSPDGRFAAVAAQARVQVWGIPAGRLLGTVKHDFWVRGLAISPDARVLFTSDDSRSGLIRTWSLPDCKPLQELKGHTGEVTCLAVSPGGWFLASGGKDQDVRLWNLADGSPLATLEDHPGHVTRLAISPDGQVVAVGSEDGSVTIWAAPGAGVAGPSAKQRAEPAGGKGASRPGHQGSAQPPVSAARREPAGAAPPSAVPHAQTLSQIQRLLDDGKRADALRFTGFLHKVLEEGAADERNVVRP